MCCLSWQVAKKEIHRQVSDNKWAGKEVLKAEWH